MKKILCVITLVILGGCASLIEKTSIEEQGDGTFTLAKVNETEWSGSALSMKLIKEAESFCHERGQTFERIEVKHKNVGRFNYTNAQLIFRCN